jgi:clan AA aspartic protease (TIGR02281 family)
MAKQIYKPTKIVGITGLKHVNSVIDTGATYTIISPQLAESIGVITTREWGDIEINACRQTLRVKKILIPSLEMDGVEIENVTGYVSDTGFDLLIGMDTLERLGMVKQTGHLRIEY